MTRRPTTFSTIAAIFITALAAGSSHAELSTPALRKAAASCRKTILQVRAKVVSAKLRALDGCTNAALSCVQTKQLRDGCFAKASDTCTGAAKSLAKSLAKASTKIVGAKSCAHQLRFPD